ncbi:MAG: AAA family ATPase [Limnohabitans sp.]
MTERKSLKERWAEMGDGGPLKALQGAQNSLWIVEGVIAPNTVNWMVAAPESFKTFIALDMAACIASGRPWHGRSTKKTRVLYISAEGGNDIHIRRAAIDIAADDTSEDFAVAQARPRIDDEEGLGFLCQTMHCIDNHKATDFRINIFYEDLLKIKHLNEEEKVRFEALGGDDNDPIDDYLWGLHKEQWNKVCDAFGYEKWNPKLPPENQKSHEFLKVVFDDEDLTLKQELCLQKYFDGLDISHRYKGYDLGYANAEKLAPDWYCFDDLLIIIDTYSQTSCDDEKSTVSRYIKTLRDVQDKLASLSEKYPKSITFLVIDHTTKQGDTYMGSLAKLGDCDTMLKVSRPNKDRFATLSCMKMKVGAPFKPIHLELKPIELEGFPDGQGRPISSLYVDGAEGVTQSRQTSSENPESAAAQVFRLIHLYAPIKLDELRRKFIDHESNQGKKPDSVKRAFSRGLESIKAQGLVTQDSEGNFSDKQS